LISVRGFRRHTLLLAFIFAVVLASPAFADQQWQAGQTVSAAGFQASEPQVALDRYGNAVSVWTQSDGTNNRILASYRTSGLTTFFGPTQTISAAGQPASEPQVAVDPAGNAVAVWSRFDGTRLRIQAAYRPAGASSTFGAVQDVSDTVGEAFGPHVAISDAGEAAATWSRFDGTNYRVQAAIRPAGGASTFAAPATLSAAGADGFESAVAVAPDGNAVAAWYRSDGLRLRIQTSTRAPAGSFSASPQTISPVTEDTFSPRLAIADTGIATAVWYGSDGVQKLRVESATRPAAGTFGSVQTVSDTSQDAFDPRVGMDAAGNAVTAFERFDGTNNRILAASKTAAGTFGAASTVSAAGQSAVDLQVDVNREGIATAIWGRFDGSRTRIQVSLRPAGGSFGAVQTINPATDGFKPQIDQSSGNAVAVWYRGDLRIQANFREAFDVPRSASRMYAALVPTFRQTISATQCTSRGGTPSTHGAPLSLVSCNPPALSTGTQAFFGPASRGYAQLAQFGGDVAVSSSLVDLQNLADSDYDPSAGADIALEVKLRVTDHANTTPAAGFDCGTTCHGTRLDSDFSVPVSCIATADPDRGSNCSVITTFNGVVPGAFVSGGGADLQVFRIRTTDSGTNGTLGDADDRTFGQAGYVIK
jgi:hypothetical protein